MSPAVQFRPLLTVPEVADRLNVSVRTVKRRIQAGELPAVRVGSSPQAPVRIDPIELEAFVESHRAPPAGEAADFPRPPHGGLEEDA
jgi:excisionase family DNA binding protein